MALFPAYAEEGEVSSKLEVEGEESVGGEEEMPTIPADQEDSLLASPSEDDASSQASQNSQASLGEGGKRKKGGGSKKKKKKKKKSRREGEGDVERYKYHNTVDYEAEFYEDHQREQGNLRVSTLYNPARPQYEYTPVLLGDQGLSGRVILKRPVVRYFSRSIDYQGGQAPPQEEDEGSRSGKKKQGPKGGGSKGKESGGGDAEYIAITDSGIVWSDSRIEEELLERTAQLNKALTANPYDIEGWLNYVKLQEERMLVDIYNKRCSESTARSNCCAKQLSILQRALETNYNSVDLMSKQVEISELCLSNEQYLSTLKGLVSTPGLPPGLLVRVWLWYVEGVQCNMALCNVTSVKEMYAAASKALLRAHKTEYQRPQLELTYRLGLFLRQCGLWEELWMLVKLNLELNLTSYKERSMSDVLEELLPTVDDQALQDNEQVILSSGLPSPTMWCRLEALRSHHHWLPLTGDLHTDTALDPQRQVYSSDLLDHVVPITTHHFNMLVNLIRLYKVPLLPQRQSTLCALGQGVVPLSWEHDGVESCLPLVHAMRGSITPPHWQQMHAKLMANIIKDLAEQPNYMDANSGLYKLVSSLLVTSASWFPEREATALLCWWIRWQRTVLFTLGWRDMTDQKTAHSMVRKAVKEVLKSRPTDTLLFCEFAQLEGEVCGGERGLRVLKACLGGAQGGLARTRATRCYVEMLLREGGEQSSGDALHALVGLALNRGVGEQREEGEVKEEDVQEVLEKFTSEADKILMSLSDCTTDMELVDHLLPELSGEWLCCQAWFVFLSQPPVAFTALYNKIRAVTHVPRDEVNTVESKRKLWLREYVLECVSTITFSKLSPPSQGGTASHEESLFQEMCSEFPGNATVAWRCAEAWGGRGGRGGPLGRWRVQEALTNTDRPSAMLAIAFTLQQFIQLYMKEVPCVEDVWQVGHSHRLLRLLGILCSHPHLRRHALLWKMWLSYAAHHCSSSHSHLQGLLYRALDQCPWNKGLYEVGCVHLPPQFGELVDLMLEKQLRLHTMPEELPHTA